MGICSGRTPFCVFFVDFPKLPLPLRPLIPRTGGARVAPRPLAANPPGRAAPPLASARPVCQGSVARRTECLPPARVLHHGAPCAVPLRPQHPLLCVTFLAVHQVCYCYNCSIKRGTVCSTHFLEAHHLEPSWLVRVFGNRFRSPDAINNTRGNALEGGIEFSSQFLHNSPYLIFLRLPIAFQG